MMEMMETTVGNQDYLNKSAVGYMVNTLLSDVSRAKVEELQAAFAAEFGDAVWTTPLESMHITLLDWLAPLVEYDDNKDDLFKGLFPRYDAAMLDSLKGIEPIQLTFNHMIISPSAIAIVADDESSQTFNTIRKRFVSEIDLLPNTKQPPNIVHATIARFVGVIALDDVRQFADKLEVDFQETVEGFQLVRETKLPMLDYSVVKAYPLIGK